MGRRRLKWAGWTEKSGYRYSGWNIALGIIFFQTVVIPIIVALDYLKCPVGVKKAPMPSA